MRSKSTRALLGCIRAVWIVLAVAVPAESTSWSSPRPQTLNIGSLLNALDQSKPASGTPQNVPLRSDRAHRAVARVIVPEEGAISYGSGTLVDIRDQFGMVITNWHVVRDANGPVEVLFPDGFRSKARALKVDADWDLAALVIWRPPVEPVKIATTAPRPGDQLTICGYGQGMYRAATGRCTQYYAPKLNMPQQMVELDVEARQGDSGGPIFNKQGELAGVLFGAGQGTTLGSFGGRVESFLATLAPDIGRRADDALVQSESGLPNQTPQKREHSDWAPPSRELGEMWTEASSVDSSYDDLASLDTETAGDESASSWSKLAGVGWYEQAKTVLAVVGMLAIAAGVLRAAR